MSAPGAHQGEISAVPQPQLRAATEAILIVADEPVTAAGLAQVLGVEEAQAGGP